MLALLVILVMFVVLLSYSNETFSVGKSHIDPWSVYVHDDVSNRELTWNCDHSDKLYYYYDD